MYWMPSTRRFVNVSMLRGQAMSSATPPKWASIWSARMIAIAIVISACRRSWPWFQRRKICCIASPRAPISRVATIVGTIQWVRLTWLLVSPKAPPSPTMCRWILRAM